MTVCTQIPITTQAQNHLESSDILNNPYFTALKNGSMDLTAFCHSQEQFYYAVKYFAQPMALLAARIPEPRARLTIIHNIVEEHGDFEPSRFHEATFRDFLRSIGCSPSLSPPESPVLSFNNLLAGICTQESLATALCCLGMIEYAFAEVSALVGQTVIENGWVEKENLAHYTLHAEIDRRHAAEFFEVVDLIQSESQEGVNRGLSLGIHAFDRLYRDLLR